MWHVREETLDTEGSLVVCLETGPPGCLRDEVFTTCPALAHTLSNPETYVRLLR